MNTAEPEPTTPVAALSQHIQGRSATVTLATMGPMELAKLRLGRARQANATALEIRLSRASKAPAA